MVRKVFLAILLSTQLISSGFAQQPQTPGVGPSPPPPLTQKPDEADVVFLPRRLISQLPAEISGPVRELARRSGATLFSTLLAAFQVTLSRWTVTSSEPC